MDNVRILLLLILIVSTNALRHNQNTIFKKTMEVIVTRSKWVSTLMIDLKPYRRLLEELRLEIQKVKTIGEHIAVNYYSNKGNYHNLMYSLRQEVITLEMHWSSMGDYLEGLKLLEFRKRRSVLPIVGKALNVLFGTITNVDLETIRRKLVAIGDSQRTLARQARSSLSILNVTRIDLTKNRQTISRLVKNVLDIKDELGQVTHSMSVELRKLGGFVTQFMQLLMAINRLKQTSQSLQLSL